jgi:hypothetical protein
MPYTAGRADSGTSAARGTDSQAYVRVTKDVVESGRLGSVYVAVEDWVDSKGLEIAGPPRETFRTDFRSAAPDDEVFDVAWPIQ